MSMMAVMLPIKPGLSLSSPSTNRWKTVPKNHLRFASRPSPFALGPDVERASDGGEVFGDHLALGNGHAVSKRILPDRLRHVEQAHVEGVEEDVNHIEDGEGRNDGTLLGSTGGA